MHIKNKKENFSVKMLLAKNIHLKGLKNNPFAMVDSNGKSKGSVSQLMDDLDLINSVEQVEVMVNSIQKGAENQKTSALVMLDNLLGVFLICSTLFRSKSNLHEYAARLRGASMR